MSLPYKGMTEARSRDLLAYDLGKKFAEMQKLITNKNLSGHQLTALLDLSYNIGIGNFAKSTLLKDVNAGNLKAASREFLKWNKVQQHPGEYIVSKGLSERRQREADEFAGHHVEMSQKNNYNISTNDPRSAADRVQERQRQSNNDLLRNAVTALDNGRPN